MTKQKPLNFNDPAPDVELRTADGAALQLSSLWRQQPTILAFTRHFGCPQCKEMLDELVERLPEFKEAGLQLAVITQADPAAAKAFGEQRAPGVLVLADPERISYKAYGLDEGSLTQALLSLRVLRSNQRLQREKGYKPELPPKGQSAMQMSGAFVIGRDGHVRLPYYYDDIADHPSVDLLVQGVLSTDWDAPFDCPLGSQLDRPTE
jgi:peroxiredoxin